MKKKNYWIRFSVLLVLIRFFSMVPVSAKWIIDPKLGNSDTASIGKIANSKAERVAYIEGDTDEIGFTTIEAALVKATQKGGSQKVVVAADTTIKNDCVISKGVELVLPCDRTGDTKKTDRMTSFDDFYTEKTGQCVCTNSRSLKYKITLANKKKITIDGSLSVLGQFGGSSSNHTSYTFGSFSQLQLMNESQLVVNSGGKINCFGFITTDYPSNTDDNILVNSGGEVYSPLTIYDWAGGGNTSKYILEKKFSRQSFAFPFLNYDMANIAAPIFLKNGSSFYGLIQINSGADNVNKSSVMVFKKALIVGKDKAFINVTSEHLVWQFSTFESLSDLSKIKAQYLAFSTHKTSVSFFGDGSIGSLSRTVIGSSVDSADFMMPMNSSFSISINGVGKEFNISKMTIWRADSSLLISSGCKCIVSADICFVYSDSDSEKDWFGKEKYSIYKKGRAYATNNGNLQFLPNISIAGKIEGNRPSIGSKVTKEVTPHFLENGDNKQYKWSWKN